MSILSPDNAQNLQFYLSGPLPCPYLPAQVERKLFVRRVGFRRSQDIVYRSACDACNACVPIRLPVRAFSPPRSLRRVWEHNRDLHLEDAFLSTNIELFNLFCAYQKARHSDSDMAHMNEADFEAMLKNGCANTHLYCLRDGSNVLKGCMIADSVGDGLSAVYSFFTPFEPRRSLGTMLILSLIKIAQERRHPFVYLGYWIKAARKMAYKSRFRPRQVLGPDGWEELEE